MRNIIETLKNVEHLPPINFRGKEMPFVSKGDGSEESVSLFGGSKNDYDLWRPYSCSTCCIKSVHDSVYPGEDISLFELIQLSVEKGVFEEEGNEVKGAFHYPMRDLLRSMGVPTQVYGLIEETTIIDALESGKVIILSIDLTKSRHIVHPESHLILVYGLDEQKDTFIVHDSASAIVDNGNAANISRQYLEALSNYKGLIVG